MSHFSTEIQGVEFFYPLVQPIDAKNPLVYRSDSANSLMGEIAETKSRQKEVEVLAKIHDFSDSDPNKGDLLASMVERMYKNRFKLGTKPAGMAWDNKEKTEVKELFKEIAHGEVMISDQAFESAIWQYSVYIHEIEENRIQSYRLHRTLLELYKDRPEYVARSYVMIVAIQMELAGSEKGYYNEVRRMAAIALNKIPPEYRKAQSVVKLMAAESFFMECEYETSIKEFDKIILNENMTERELIAARYMKSKALLKLNREEEALDVLLESLPILPTFNNSFTWAGEIKNTVYISINQAHSLALRLKRYELANSLKDLLNQLSMFSFSFKNDILYFPDTVYMYTENELSASLQEGSLDHACICPWVTEWRYLFECAHFTEDPDENCSITQCFANDILHQHCTVNPDAPDNPSGANDCPPYGPYLEKVIIRQRRYVRSDGSNIPGCPNKTPYIVYAPAVDCKTHTFKYRCKLGSCGGTGYTWINSMERKGLNMSCD